MIKVISLLKYILLAIVTIVAIILCFLLLILTFNSKIVIKFGSIFWAKIIMLTLGAKLKTTGLNNIKPNKTYIILANHTSNLDIPILMTGLPIIYYFIAKKEMKKIPFLGWIMTAVGMIFIDRSNKNTAIVSMRKAGSKIKKGKSVMIFPEGTFDEVEGLLPFKKGAFHLAIHAGVDILPVAILGAPKVWPVNDNFKLKPGRVELRIGEPINTEGLALEAVSSLLEKTKVSIESLLKNPTT